MNKSPLIFILAILFLLPFVYSTSDVKVDFRLSSQLINRSYTYLNNYLNRNWYSLNSNNTVYTEAFGDNDVTNVYLLTYNDSDLLGPNGGTLEIVPGNMLSFAKIKWAAGELSNFAFLIRFNHTYRMNSNSVLSVYFKNYTLSAYSTFHSFLNKNIVNRTYLGLYTAGSSCNLCQKNTSLSTFTDTEFNEILISSHSSSDGVLTTTNLLWFNISHLTDVTTNQLPSFNVSINSSQCLHRREDNGRLYFDISVNDPEGDTIYYFTDSLTALTENVTTKFTKRECSDSVLLGPILSKYFCANVKDYTFQDYLVYPSSDVCRVTESVYNSSMFNLYYSDSDLGRGYGLQFQSSCTAADKSIYYDMGLPSRKFNVVTEFRQLANGDAFNLSVLDESFSEVLRIRANTTNNRLLLYDNDSLVINITSQENTLLELRDVAVDTSHYTFKAWNSNAYTFPYLTGAYTTGTADMTKLNSPAKYLKIQHATGNYLLMGIQTRGAVQTPTYTTTQPQYINITGTGKYVIDIYVTDSVHLATNYTKQSYNKYIDLCEYTGESIIEGELIEDFNVFEFFKALFGGSFKEYLSVIDTNNIGPKILWWAYLIIFLSMLFSTYLIMQRFDATLPLLTSSFVVLVISYAIEYTLHFWTSLIFIALTVAWGLAPAFSGGGKGE